MYVFTNISTCELISNYISEGSVSHINGVRPSFLENTAVSRSVIFAHATHVEQYACAKKLINAASW